MKINGIMKIFIFSIIFHYIISGSVSLIEENSKYLNSIYRNFFSISNDSMKYETNGGTMNPLYLAFGDEQEKGWISVGSQGEEYTNSETKIKYESLVNYVNITFEKTTLISKMIYRAMVVPNSCPIVGYPKELKVYYRMRNEKGEFNEEDDFILVDEIISDATNKTVLFSFSKIIKSDQIKLEWAQTSYCSNFYKKRAAASEIKLLIPETENINENIINAFSDYNRLTLSKEFDNEKFVKQLKQELKILDFSFYPRKYIERIEAVFNGSLTFNPKREFTTNQKNKESNIIKQKGDIYNYARNKLLISRAGLNRQITGIFGRTNETITIYVTADNASTPLPCIQFSQFAGERVNWKGKEKCLELGEQTFIVDDFLVENYKYKVNPGGPIYILNTYTPEQQSQNVKIYIDDGLLFPTFKLDDDEEKYNQNLKEYIELCNKNENTYIDMTELESDNIMISVKATDAYKVYSEENKGPQKNLLAWEVYLRKIYAFYGIELNPNSPDFDIKNSYLNIHLRFNQPLPPYAVTEYIGIYDEDWVKKSLYIIGQETDWDLTCQIADMMDIRETFIFEILNRLAAKYSEIVIKGEKNNERNNLYEEKIKYLTLNETNNLRGCLYEDTKQCKGFLQNRRNNYLIFWDLESYCHGFWAKVQNLYRKEYEIASELTSTERMVYFCSRALGIDLGYYFTRWGLYLEGVRDTIFSEEKASTKYKNLMKQEILEGRIEQNEKKFWYLDNDEYNYLIDIGEGCYENIDEYDIQIGRISGYNGGYVIELPNVRCPGHLGFEIYESDKLIGFTYEREFTDSTKYEDGFTPKYNIIAYDRFLVPSKPSENKSP